LAELFLSTAKVVGEIAICAALCGHFGVPVWLVTGDAATCREARAILGDGVKTVCVKEGLTRFSGRCLAPQEAWRKIEMAVAEVVPISAQKFRPINPQSRRLLRVEFTAPEHVRGYLHAGVRQVDERTVEVTAENFYAAWRLLWRR
jgi:D-amino peptidase